VNQGKPAGVTGFRVAALSPDVLVKATTNSYDTASPLA